MNDSAPPRPPKDFDRELQKAVVKEALKEWLDAQWAVFGKWSGRGIAATLFSALVYWWLSSHGWHK